MRSRVSSPSAFSAAMQSSPVITVEAIRCPHFGQVEFLGNTLHHAEERLPLAMSLNGPTDDVATGCLDEVLFRRPTKV